MPPPDRSRRPLDLKQRSVLAGEAAAAVTEVETALAPPADPTAAAFFDVDNTVMQGASIFHLARGLLPARVLHDPRDPRRRLEAALLPRGRRRGPRARGRGAQLGARLHRGPHRRGARGARRGDLRRGHGPPDLARHPGARPAAPRRGPAGLAGHRRAASRSPASSPAGSASPARWAPSPSTRTASTPGGWSATCCTARPRPRRSRRSPSARGSTCPAARPTPTPSTTCRCCRWSATRARSIPTPGCGRTPAGQGWRVRDYRTGRKAARAGLLVGAARRRGGAVPWPLPSRSERVGPR